MSAGEPLLEARNLVKEFTTNTGGVLSGKKRAFRAVDDVSFAVGRARTVAVVGESGSGKSTTARMVARLMPADGGSVLLDGEDVTHGTGAALKHFRSQVQVVFQDPFSSLNPRHTVDRIITAPLDYQGMGVPGGKRQLVKGLMERVGLNPDHSGRYPSQFSGGQAQRIGIARALAVKPKLLICDEAVSALDVSVQAQVINLFKSLQAEDGYSIIFIAHDLAVVRQIAHDVVVMNRGAVVESGTRDEIFDNPTQPYTRSLLAAIPTINPEWEARRRVNEQRERAALT
ncbi:ATP-binding cassette domain-containing protein [Specibacter cremeus]|uniref:ATP-binding cassette domain-containing protein n=1 Tax=Specibacter cremeus TaxID=1629051 RepID=UPI000F767931|nr:ATP-binding cassette domain-containing protein [Specibacter cremeus]